MLKASDVAYPTEEDVKMFQERLYAEFLPAGKTMILTRSPKVSKWMRRELRIAYIRATMAVMKVLESVKITPNSESEDAKFEARIANDLWEHVMSQIKEMKIWETKEDDEPKPGPELL